MTTAYDVPADALIKKTADSLKKNDKAKAPEWASFVKTGVHKEMPPEDPDWWYTRMAAVLRKIYVKGPIGVSRLTAEFGGPRDRGAKPNRARTGSGSIARHCIHQLEELGYVEKQKTQGRVVTGAGRSFLDNNAREVSQVLQKDIPALKKY